ncbi:hypothetical protein D3C86_1230150 [compost metagenome]
MPDPHHLLARLDVDVARPAADRVVEDGVEQSHDRLVLDRDLVGQALLGGGGALLAVLHADRGDRVGDLPLHAADQRLVSVVELLAGGDEGLGPQAGDEADLVQGVHVVGVDHGHVEVAVLDAQGQHLVARQELLREEVEQIRVELALADLDVVGTGLGAEHVAQLVLGDEGALEQDLAERLARLAALLEGAVDLAGLDEAGLHEQLAQLAADAWQGTGSGNIHRIFTLSSGLKVYDNPVMHLAVSAVYPLPSRP